MIWNIESYVSDVGRYFVSLRGVGDWTVLDPLGTVYDGFTNENDAMAFAESLNYELSYPTTSPPEDGSSLTVQRVSAFPLAIPAKEIIP